MSNQPGIFLEIEVLLEAASLRLSIWKDTDDKEDKPLFIWLKEDVLFKCE